MEPGWALGSGLRGRLWAGPWDLLGSGPGCGLALGRVGVRLCHGIRLGPGVCGIRARLRSGVCGVGGGLWAGPWGLWGRAGPWGLGAGVGYGLAPGVCGARLGGSAAGPVETAGRELLDGRFLFLKRPWKAQVELLADGRVEAGCVWRPFL